MRLEYRSWTAFAKKMLGSVVEQLIFSNNHNCHKHTLHKLYSQWHSLCRGCNDYMKENRQHIFREKTDDGKHVYESTSIHEEPPEKKYCNENRNESHTD